MAHALDARLAALSLEDRARILARAAMQERLRAALERREDLPWFRSVCEDLKERVRRLTPNRRDLCEAWDRGFDVDLLLQMVEHHAVDAGDVDVMIDLVFDRLEMCCAPVQDEAVAQARTQLRNESDAVKKLSSLMDMADAILCDMEGLLADLRS